MNGSFLLSVLILFAASSVVLTGIVLLAIRLFGKRTRHAVCCLILAVCAIRILIPTGIFFSSLIPISLDRETSVTVRRTEPQTEPIGGTETPAVPSDTTAVGSGTQTTDATVLAATSEPAESPAYGEVEQAGERVRLDDLLPYLIAGVWGGGALIAFCLLRIPQYVSARRIRRSATPAQGEILRIYRDVCGEFPLRTHPVLLVAQTGVVPHLCGLFRPAIVIGKTDLSPQELSMVFRHELNHFRRRDLWIRRILFADVCIFWWNPLVRLFVRAAQAETELACDEAVLRGLDESGRCAYGQTILSVMRENVRSPIGLNVGFSVESDRVLRFRELLDTSPRRSGTVFALFLCFLLVASAAVVGCARNDSNGTVLTLDSAELDAKHVRGLAQDLEAPEKNGYRFTGWEVRSEREENGSVSVSFEPRYSPIVYSVGFETNGGTLPAGTSDRYTVESALPTPTREGAVFGGWFFDAELSRPVTAISAENCTLYAAWGDETPAGDFRVVRHDGWISVSGYDGNASRVTVPAYIDGLPVREIGVNAFSFCTSVVSLTLPDSVRRIGAGAFRYCYRLESVSFGSLPVEQIDRSAFEACYALSRIDCPGAETERRSVFGFDFDALFSR